MSLLQLEAHLDGLCSFSALRGKMIELGFVFRQRGGCNHQKYKEVPEEDIRDLTYEELMRKYGMSMATIYLYKKKLREPSPPS